MALLGIYLTGSYLPVPTLQCTYSMTSFFLEVFSGKKTKCKAHNVTKESHCTLAQHGI